MLVHVIMSVHKYLHERYHILRSIEVESMYKTKNYSTWK